MKLIELLASRQGWGEAETIYATEPWSENSEAMLSTEDRSTTEPILWSGITYAYFLEGFIACQLLDDLGAPAGNISGDDCNRLISYAINDA